MFDKKFKQLSAHIEAYSAYIKEQFDKLNARIDDIIKSIKDGNESKKLRETRTYINYMHSDLQFLEIEQDDNIILYERIGKDLIDISVFMEFHEVPKELVKLFSQLRTAYTHRYTNVFGKWPACYEYWTEAESKAKITKGENNANNK